MVSLPAPVVMMLAADEPVIDTDEDSPEASRFWKLATLVASPVVWSTLPRLTVVTARSTSVLLPVPPSITLSEP
jgi:hypothetical protein